MGIDYSAKLMVGVHFGDLPEELQEIEDIWEWAEENGIELAAAYFDADEYGQFVGVSLSPPPFPMTDEWLTALGVAHTVAAFKLNVKPEIKIVPDIY
jgi:hypothetical protein